MERNLLGEQGLKKLMKEICSETIRPEIQELLSFATSKVTEEYQKYMQLNQRKLYAYDAGEVITGCIGIEFLAENSCEIKHIAVFSEYRGQQIGSKMIDWVSEKYGFSSVLAETDQDAVEFYRKNGFEIMCLGEKYPGRERFLCRKKISET
jgi:ribosomal protein S18 acetylase RimI-like enzyme